MAIPPNLADLLHPTKFNYPANWMDEFGPYGWFYLAGFVELCAELKLKNNKNGRKALNKLIPRALNRTPRNWKGAFIDPHPKSGWPNLAPKQLRKAFHQEAMRLDKAALIYVLLDTYVEEVGAKIDVSQRMSIQPAIFLVDEYDKPKYDAHLRDQLSADDFRAELQRTTFQSTIVIFRRMAEGKAVTHTTASSFKKFWHEKIAKPGLGPVVALTERPDGVGNKEPCSEEIVIHPQ